MKRRITKAFPHLYLDRGGRKDQDGIREERWRYRPPGGKTVSIREQYGTAAFAAAYRAAVEGLAAPQKKAPKGGTMKDLVDLYTRSVNYHNLRSTSRRVRNSYLRRFTEPPVGDLPFAKLTRAFVKELLAPLMRTPGAAQNTYRALKALMNLAVEDGLRDDNPCIGVKLPKLSAEGIHPWSAEERAQFESFYPIGTQARLIYALALYTGQRIGDIVRMGPQHIFVVETEDGPKRYIAVTQGKTGKNLSLPIPEVLQEALDGSRSGHLNFVVNRSGSPFRNGTHLSHHFARYARAAELNNCSAHGLRKACCEALAEKGCTELEIMAISGHTSLTEVQRYTKGVNQRHMADRAMAKTYQQNVVALPTKGKGVRGLGSNFADHQGRLEQGSGIAPKSWDRHAG